MSAFSRRATRSGRSMSECARCRGWCRSEEEKSHRCPVDLSGQLWRREERRDPYQVLFTCPGCGLRVDNQGAVWSHLCEGEAAVAAFRADLEAAIETARTEGALHALETAALIAEEGGARHAATWGERSAGHTELLRVAAEIRARKGKP